MELGIALQMGMRGSEINAVGSGKLAPSCEEG